MNEFEIIQRYFLSTRQDDQVILGIGDDAAILRCPPSGYDLVVSMDTLVAGVHFLATTPADDIGYKALAVNLSDIAAMGATPKWFTLSLTMPSFDDTWLQLFTHGLNTLATEYNLTLIGGDLCRGQLSITIQAHGLVPCGESLTRSGAQLGDSIYITGCLGGAALACHHHQLAHKEDILKLHRPQPQIAMGCYLRPYANSCIDISDGLSSDLKHLLNASKLGAHIDLRSLAMAPSLASLAVEQAYDFALSGGDDYELCFSSAHHDLASQKPPFPITKIGTINSSTELIFTDAEGKHYIPKQGWQHF